LEQLSRMARLRWLLQRAAVLCYEENCLSVSKGAAYSALLSLFPVLTAIAAVLVQVRAGPVLTVLQRFLSEVVPPGTESLLLERFAVKGQRPVYLLVVAVLLALYAASGVVLSLMEGFNNVYHIPSERPFLRKRAVAALLVFGSAMPAIGMSALILFGSHTEELILRWLGQLPAAGPPARGLLFAGKAAEYVVALTAVVLVTQLMYYVGPNRPQSLNGVWAGSVVATVLWLAATQAFAWYARNLAGYNLMYGSVGAVIALIVWMYLLAVISLYGCAFNAAREQLLTAETSLPRL